MQKLGIAILCFAVVFVSTCASELTAENCRDDGVFCNGIERLVDGKCIKVPADPCDDGASCTVDTCDEGTKTCTHTPTGECAICDRSDCILNCNGKTCGSDGCGGSCGTCAAGKACTPAGSCSLANALGTCAKPRPLAVQLGSGKAQTIMGDTSQSVSQLIPTCNQDSRAVEDVYSFTITVPTGIEATTQDYDTVLSIRRDCQDNRQASTVACSDDAAPPGNYGSRVTALLAPGTYFLIVDGFSEDDFGPYTLKVKFVAGCIPNCDGQFCDGNDGCGGSCGGCDADERCGPDLRCRPFPCTPNCKNTDGSRRVCGDSGCLGSCGTCAPGQLCVPKNGTCAAFPSCDHASPTCNPGCAEGSFCGSDCACHKVTVPLPDLVVNTQRLKDEVLFDSVVVASNSCSVLEQCVGGLGKRRLLRISVEAINQGRGALSMDEPEKRPDLFHYSACHGHYHFDNFATYALLDKGGKEVVQGRKQAYCMEDTRQVVQGPNIACNKLYSCTDQGIQAGWSDLYGNALDCQWLDITDVPAGDYQISVTLNPGRLFQEVTTDNNTSIVPVHIPPS